jgi:pilus assembly protein CpaB
MTPRRRAILLSGLAILLGVLAASDVSGREQALRRDLGAPVAVVVAAADVPAGTRLAPGRLAVRQIPSRYAPALSYANPAALAGQRTAVAIPRGTAIVTALLDRGDPQADEGPPLRKGERIADLVAVGSPALVRTGGRVDVLVTREQADGQGSTTLALEDAEVLSASPAPAGGHDDDGTQRVRVALRVTLRQAVTLAAAQNFARELRVLPRAAGDDATGNAGLEAGG